MQPADLKDMAKCCKDLSHFGAEGSAVKGYIAMLPLFRSAPERKAQPPWLPGAPQKEARTYALNQQLADLVDTIIHEKSVLSLVFSTWKVGVPARCLHPATDLVGTRALRGRGQEDAGLWCWTWARGRCCGTMHASQPRTALAWA